MGNYGGGKGDYGGKGNYGERAKRAFGGRQNSKVNYMMLRGKLRASAASVWWEAKSNP